MATKDTLFSDTKRTQRPGCGSMSWNMGDPQENGFFESENDDMSMIFHDKPKSIAGKYWILDT